MRRTIACVLGLLLLAGIAPGASGKTGVHGSAGRVAFAGWWRHSGDTGHLYYLDVSDWAFADADRPHAMRAYFSSVPCAVNERGRPAKCHHDASTFERVKVQSLEIDPVLMSAHAILRRGRQRAELTWTGKGNYNQPFVFQSVSEYLFPPYFVGASAWADVISVRRASVKGKVFDLDFSRKEFGQGALVDFVEGGASACSGSFFC
jgi:hypothetical protein